MRTNPSREALESHLSQSVQSYSQRSKNGGTHGVIPGLSASNTSVLLKIANMRGFDPSKADSCKITVPEPNAKLRIQGLENELQDLTENFVKQMCMLSKENSEQKRMCKVQGGTDASTVERLSFQLETLQAQLRQKEEELEAFRGWQKQTSHAFQVSFEEQRVVIDSEVDELLRISEELSVDRKGLCLVHNGAFADAVNRLGGVNKVICKPHTLAPQLHLQDAPHAETCHSNHPFVDHNDVRDVLESANATNFLSLDSLLGVSARTEPSVPSFIPDAHVTLGQACGAKLTGPPRPPRLSLTFDCKGMEEKNDFDLYSDSSNMKQHTSRREKGIEHARMVSRAAINFVQEMQSSVAEPESTVIQGGVQETLQFQSEVSELTDSPIIKADVKSLSSSDFPTQSRVKCSIFDYDISDIDQKSDSAPRGLEEVTRDMDELHRKMQICMVEQVKKQLKEAQPSRQPDDAPGAQGAHGTRVGFESPQIHNVTSPGPKFLVGPDRRESLACLTKNVEEHRRLSLSTTSRLEESLTTGSKPPLGSTSPNSCHRKGSLTNQHGRGNDRQHEQANDSLVKKKAPFQVKSMTEQVLSQNGLHVISGDAPAMLHSKENASPHFNTSRASICDPPEVHFLIKLLCICFLFVVGFCFSCFSLSTSLFSNVWLY